MKIAVSGKGGTGKTTFVSLLAQAYRNRGRKVFAIDADSDSNLAVTLGLPAEKKIIPLSEMHDLIHERTGAVPGASNVFFAMNPRVDDIPDTCAVDHNGIKLMVMGTVRRGGSGCACPEHIIVREFLRHLLVERDEVVLIDTAAGIEHLSRGMAQYVDVLVVVVQPTAASIQTFHRISAMAADLGIKKIVAVANRVRADAELCRIKNETGVDLIGIIPESGELADYHGLPVGPEIEKSIASIIDCLDRAIE
jgi:CO dehydrogenase maturation factor